MNDALGDMPATDAYAAAITLERLARAEGPYVAHALKQSARVLRRLAIASGELPEDLQRVACSLQEMPARG